MFNGEIATIEIINRLSPTSGAASYYDKDWNMMKNIAFVKYTKGTYQPPPQCLAEMIYCVKTLSKTYEIFVRIDFYATSRGAVFGEFTPTPGCAKYITSETDKNFIHYWNRFCVGMI